MTAEAKKIVTFAAFNNAGAAAYLEALIDYVHLVDDLHDRDNPEAGEAEHIAGILARWNHELLFNPFVAANRERLAALMEQALSCWVDSHSLPRGQERAADVIKGQYHEIVFHVARLTGGWSHKRECERMFRDYDFEDVKTANAA